MLRDRDVAAAHGLPIRRFNFRAVADLACPFHDGAIAQTEEDLNTDDDSKERSRAIPDALRQHRPSPRWKLG